MNAIECAVAEAIAAGVQVDLARLGGEDVLYADADGWPRSKVFGDITEVLLRSWNDLKRPEEAYRVIVAGIKDNGDRLTMAHATEAIAETPPPDLRRVVHALDRRARDDGSADMVRIEAAAAILRFAIIDSRWSATASASLQILEELEDDYALSAVARLAAVGWEHFPG